MMVINPLMGRYGATIGGKWIPFTDYSDELTRATLKKDTLELVDQYKNVPGVLMFAFGNESNYGLSWKSFEIENLPEGERNREKAKYLYSLFNEVMSDGKKIDPNHPFTIVNGDLQYIDLIAEYCTDMDLLGVNAYRGKSFTGLWDEVTEEAGSARAVLRVRQRCVQRQDLPGGSTRSGHDPEGPVAGDVQQELRERRGRQRHRRLCLRVARRVVEVPAGGEPGYPRHQRLVGQWRLPARLRRGQEQHERRVVGHRHPRHG